jgi:peptidoglycan L-alanyl-D-glutamate endopeptidase CwlK
MDFAVRLLVALIDWIARLNKASASRRASHPYDGPKPGHDNLHSRFGGRAWRYGPDGVFADNKAWRTSGSPVTCRAILSLYGDIILAAARKHGVNPALIVMTIATETGGMRSSGFTGPKTFRWEPHVHNRDTTPPFDGSYSAGPMQILATTARSLIREHGEEFGLAYAPLTIAPTLIKQPSPAPEKLALYDPTANIDLGAAYIRANMKRTGDDPILVAAAYNSGGLYETRNNAWRLRSYGDHLDRAARWYGDACAVLKEAGIV